MAYLKLSKNIVFSGKTLNDKLQKARRRFERDLSVALIDKVQDAVEVILQDKSLLPEQYELEFNENQQIHIYASDDLGYIYALLFISEKYLGIPPFWFWNEAELKKKETVEIPCESYLSTVALIPHRGWFINDEVLLHRWTIAGDPMLAWEMAFEALLRCGGNMVIPGTDENSREFRAMASLMGLSITHHHAEPLGAKMFARAYPELNPSYDEHPELFEALWESAIDEQKELKVVWNLGFRGQGDYPFWKNDPKYQTPESRGQLISELITKQYNMIKEKVEQPMCCTNLYGEVMELYNQGHIHLPENVIKIWADNGYGKMVNRRQGSHNPRIVALPDLKDERDAQEKHGAYYHVSFYDLQAANHMTLSPNNAKFYQEELAHAYEKGIKDFWIINCSNIKPHTYYLDLIKEFWQYGKVDALAHRKSYIEQYYGELSSEMIRSIGNIYDAYSASAVEFGLQEDEKAGEQYYNYSTRILASEWMNKVEAPSKALNWIYPYETRRAQVEAFEKHCQEAFDKFQSLHDRCELLSQTMSESTRRAFELGIKIHVEVHLRCLAGSISFCQAYKAFWEDDLKKSFYLTGVASEQFMGADQAMKATEKGVWVGFYKNECLSDCKFTSYLLKNLMAVIRNIGDGPHYFHWQRDYLCEREDRDVILITNMDNHLTNEELFEWMKSKGLVK